jgi:alginate O-acetyltransferase complex protein AlgI
MLFNSLNFAIFFPVVFLLYWLVANKNLTLQNILLLVASYFFYATWDYRFLFLLIFSTLLDYFSGIQIDHAKTKQQRKFWLWLSISLNLGVLGLFKYYNFFISSFADAISQVGLQVNVWSLNMILPVGISFYTFHGLSYIFDIYNGKIKPARNIIDYSVFVGFFPLLVAGPIERATHLLPQVQQTRKFEKSQAVDGLRQILWGFFKKIVIADNCAVHVNQIFENYSDHSGSTLVWGAVLFAFQVYGDFSGYSDIALGTARLLGFNLLRNFAFPYFSRDIAEYWRRWHISLTSWLRDYLYIPLGGSRVPRWKIICNVFIIFLVSGLWHGANWTFIVWGLINALYFLPLLLIKQNRKNLNTPSEGKLIPTLHESMQILFTFMLVVFARIFFRAENLDHAFGYVAGIFSLSFFSLPTSGLVEIPLIFLMMTAEWVQREKQHALQLDRVPVKAIRWTLYMSIILIIFCFGASPQDFIYFQF